MILSLLFSSVVGVFVKASTLNYYAIDSYAEYLKTQDEDSYNKFLNATQEEKDIFIVYINNPRKLFEDANLPDSPIETSVKERVGSTDALLRSSGVIRVKNISQSYTQSLLDVHL